MTLHGAMGMIEPVDNDKRKRPANASLDEARLRQQAIGVKLRQMFDNVVSEPVPDEFLEILRRGDDKNAAGQDPQKPHSGGQD